jgi:predicted amidohydrolase YtcJ
VIAAKAHRRLDPVERYGHEIGSLEPGKLADRVILDRDPRKVDPESIRMSRVTETWMDGRRVFAA